MLNEEIIGLGDKVDLLGHFDRLYRTMIEDIAENRFFLVGIPRFSGTPMPLHIGESIHLIFYRDSGRFISVMEVVQFEKRGNVRYVWLYQKTEPIKNQRRDAFRVPTIIDVEICKYVEGMDLKLSSFGGVETIARETVTSRDISVIGVSIITGNKYEVGKRFLLKLHLLWPTNTTPPFHTCAKVMRVSSWRDSGKNIVGMSFFGHTKEMNEYITKYVLDEQRRQLKQKKLIEE